MFGIEALDENSVKVLGMEDFTLKKIFEATIPEKAKAYGENLRTDRIVFNIPGYNQNTCFVVITPRTYIQSAQKGYDDGPYTPYYVDLGGDSIGVYTYFQARVYPNGNYWLEWTPICSIEVFEVL